MLTRLGLFYAHRWRNHIHWTFMGVSDGVVVRGLDQQTLMSKLEFHWVLHSYGLVPYLSKKLSKLLYWTFIQQNRIYDGWILSLIWISEGSTTEWKMWTFRTCNLLMVAKTYEEPATLFDNRRTAHKYISIIIIYYSNLTMIWPHMIYLSLNKCNPTIHLIKICAISIKCLLRVRNTLLLKKQTNKTNKKQRKRMLHSQKSSIDLFLLLQITVMNECWIVSIKQQS